MTHKYRGLTEECRWTYGHYCKVEGKHYIILDDAELFPSNFDDGKMIYGFIRVFPKTVGQYIGRKDEKGVEIYQHDKVRLFFYDGSYEDGIIQYNCKTSRYEFQTEDGNYSFDDSTPCEVIGNIHQNPELKEN